VDELLFLAVTVVVESSSIFIAVEETTEDEPATCWRACRRLFDDGYILVARFSILLLLLLDKGALAIDVGVKATTAALSKVLQLTTNVVNAKTAAEKSLRLDPFVLLFAFVLLLLLLQL